MGAKSNFFREFNVSTTAYANCLIRWDFVSAGIALMLENPAAGDKVFYSFDGVDDHGSMTPGEASEAIIFDARHTSRIWFRRESAGTVRIRFEAWQ